jgi:hypothetical protein
VIVEVDTRQAPATIAVRDPDDLRRFHVEMLGDRADRFAAAVPRFGTVADGGDAVFVRPDALIALVGAPAQDVDWRRSFEEMVAYARSKGWVHEDGSLRAHVERSHPETEG